MTDYYDPGSNYGLNKDWKKNKLSNYKEFKADVRDMSWEGLNRNQTRRKQNEMINNFWGPGGKKAAFNTPFGEQMADQDPIGTFYRNIGQGGAAFSDRTRFGQFARNQYDEIFNSYRAAAQRNPLLRFDDYIQRANVRGLIDQKFNAMTPTQRGEQGPFMQQRWV